MMYEYWLPDEKGIKTKYKTENNAVIIIGANGAGKSKLGAWIEQNDLEKVHRVSAQRNLNFSEKIPLKSYSEAEKLLFYGSDNINPKKSQRWNYGHYTTNLLDDFNYVLAKLIAQKNNETSKFAEECKKAGDDKNKWPDTPITSIDRLKSIWSEILPQRHLVEKDAKFYAMMNCDEQCTEYSATEMSDGERAVLYLVAQVLCVPENKTIIIDEPEVHLHRCIMDRLWTTLEQYRQDCLFIYITHDLQFSASRFKSDKIWIKEYDGKNWKFLRITDDDKLPEELKLEILGCRRKVLFVEGERQSYDYQLYKQLYPEYLIIPCGGCSQVISRTKAFRSSESLHDFNVYGLIDRDYRSDKEIKALKKDHIYVLGVAEVENLFLVEELIVLMAKRVGVKDIDETIKKIKDFVINSKFKNMINRQICQSVVSEIKYQLSCIEISTKKDNDAKESLESGLDAIKYEQIKSNKEIIFNHAYESNDYKEILKCFNEKGVSAEIGKYLGLDNKKYQEKVINLLYGECKIEIIKALEEYLPKDIPR